MEENKPKSNWTKFIEAFIGTIKDHTGKGSASRMATFTCLCIMCYITIADQSFKLTAHKEIFGSWAVILVCLLGINGPIVEVLDGLGRLIQIVRGIFKSENKKAEEPKL